MPKQLVSSTAIAVVAVLFLAVFHPSGVSGFIFHWNVKGTPNYTIGPGVHGGKRAGPGGGATQCADLPNALLPHNCIQQPVDIRLVGTDFGKTFPGVTPPSQPSAPPSCNDGPCGPSAMFFPWTASAWYNNFNAWLAQHTKAITTTLSTDLPADYKGYVVIEYGNMFLAWDPIVMEQSANFVQFAHSFRTMVSQVNMPVFNETFLSFAGYTPPSGASNYEALSRPEQMALLAQAYEPTIQSYINATLKACREARPNVQGWGLHGYPWQYSLQTLQTPATLAQVRASNNELGWAWSQVDLLLPSFFPTQYVTADPGASPCPSDAVSSTVNEQWYASNLVELNRIRDTFNPSALILPYVWWQVQQCEGTMPTAPVYQSSPGVANMLQTPYAYKADGVIIWGDCAEVSSAPPGENATAIASQLNNVWAPYIQQLADSCANTPPKHGDEHVRVVPK